MAEPEFIGTLNIELRMGSQRQYYAFLCRDINHSSQQLEEFVRTKIPPGWDLGYVSYTGKPNRQGPGLSALPTEF